MSEKPSAATSGPAWMAQAHDPLPASSRPMLEGLGRLSRFRSAIEPLASADRRDLLASLDELSRPMTPLEIEQALIATGLSRSDRKRLVLALKRFPIVMVAH